MTVSIASATGSGATATATLASNAGGVIRKTGAGALQQQTNDNSFDGEIEVAEGSLKLNGAGFPSASLNVRPGASLLPVKGTTSSVGRLVATNGIAEIKADGSSGTATLNIGSLSVNQGLALVTHTNSLALALTATDSTTASSSASPVVNGLVYANKDASKYRSPLPFERAENGSLSLVTTTATPGPDANWRPTSNYSTENAPEVSEVNSIIMRLSNDPGLDCYVKNSGNIEIKSGMIVCQRPNEGTVRMNVTGGGAFTTRAKDGMFIYGDNKEPGKRSRSDANDNAVYFGEWRRLYGPFADPDGSTPMSLTVAGEKQSRPELGAQAWLLGVQTFSGGLNLVNGGVFIQADSGLGASGSPVCASGYCSIASYNWTFDISHPIELCDGSALIFSPNNRTGNTISSTFSGSGDLLTSDVNRRGCSMAFTGDHSAFTGDYYIQGHARIAPAIFSANAGIKLADGTNLSATSLLAYDEDAGWFVLLYAAPSAYKGGAFAVAVGFAAQGGAAGAGRPSYRLEPVMFVPQWSSKNPQATGAYGEGFDCNVGFVGAYYDKLKKLNAYYESLRLGLGGVPELSFAFRETSLNEQGRKITVSSASTASAVDTLWQDGLTATVNGKGAIVVAKATKPVQDKETKEWYYSGANDGALTLSFAQATGIFKGSYTFWYDYMSAYDDTKPDGKRETYAHASKKVSFEGILVQGEEPKMNGFYLWDATGVYEDEKTGKEKTYKYKVSFPVAFGE